VQQQRELLPDPGLADEVIEAPGPQRALDQPLVAVGEGGDNALVGSRAALGKLSRQ
jgi:hypothetical protein